jgi:predicted nucleotidyltransferase
LCDELTTKQKAILDHVGAWAATYPCIKVMHVFGSIARNEETAESDIDIAIEYVENLHSDMALTACYAQVNGDWESLAASLKVKFGHQPKIAGLFPPYDHKAWAAIRAGREIGKSGKATLTWTAPKAADCEHRD